MLRYPRDRALSHRGACPVPLGSRDLPWVRRADADPAAQVGGEGHLTPTCAARTRRVARGLRVGRQELPLVWPQTL